MPQYVVLIYSAESGRPATEDNPEEHNQHADALAESGKMIGAFAFTPREEATSVRATGVTAGTFNDTKETVAGFYILEADNIEAAVATAKANPVLREGGGLEIRPVHSGGLAGA